MSDLTILKERNPAVAEFIEHWRSKYQRTYNFSKTEDQADFYEGMLEMARHVATNNDGADMSATANATGVSAVGVAIFAALKT